MPLFRNLRAQGRDVEALTKQPVLSDTYAWFLERFLELNHHRQHGFAGVQPLALCDILAFCEVLGLEHCDQRLFLYFMQGLDRVFLTWANKAKPGAGK